MAKAIVTPPREDQLPIRTTGRFVAPEHVNVQLRNVSGALWRRLKVQAALRDAQLGDLTTEALLEWLERHESETQEVPA